MPFSSRKMQSSDKNTEGSLKPSFEERIKRAISQVSAKQGIELDVRVCPAHGTNNCTYPCMDNPNDCSFEMPSLDDELIQAREKLESSKNFVIDTYTKDSIEEELKTETEHNVNSLEWKEELKERLKVSKEMSDIGLIERVVTLQKNTHDIEFTRMLKFYRSLLRSLYVRQKKPYFVRGFTLPFIKTLVCPDKRHLLPKTLKEMESLEVIERIEIAEKFYYRLTQETMRELTIKFREVFNENLPRNSR